MKYISLRKKRKSRLIFRSGLFLWAFVIGLNFDADAQDAAMAFPPMKGQNLQDEAIQIPNPDAEKLTLVGLACKRKAEPLLKTWFEPCYNKFVLKSGMFDSAYDIELYFIPFFSGLQQPLKEADRKQLKKSENKELFPYIVHYQGTLKPYKNELHIENKDLPYLYVIDGAGNILHQVKGRYSDSKMEAIEEVLSR